MWPIFNDLIDFATMKYENHPSIIICNENVSFESRKNVSKNNVQQKTSNLNFKKTGTFGNIPTKILKCYSDLYNVIVQYIWNYEI